MITDNLSGAKGTTQSSAIIWLSLNPSLSMSGAPRHHPIANLWYLSLAPDNQSGRCIGTPVFVHLQHLSPRLSVHSISSFYTLQMFTILLLLLLLLLCRIITLLLLLFCIMFIAILWSIAILCIVVHCVNCITICVNIFRSNK